MKSGVANCLVRDAKQYTRHIPRPCSPPFYVCVLKKVQVSAPAGAPPLAVVVHSVANISVTGKVSPAVHAASLHGSLTADTLNAAADLGHSGSLCATQPPLCVGMSARCSASTFKSLSSTPTSAASFP
ncbi:hypothetical protein E2C01_057642 [Portunus trituberculatus]|uniref:Uncharacterized protein n=1 Tax=Portunus trituberculatus TaxID=210409 RepID=A0A5B7H3Y6_PORTR|nr:hypothetical protein [Portunus trituberculatus]